jgi:ATP-dependent RNA helicase RhlE
MDDPSVLVFTRTRRGAKKLARTLNDAGHDVGELHGDCSPGQRERAMGGFRSRRFPVLVATNIAARGLDVRHVTHVVNFDVPAAPEEYVHRIGRTGRAGDEGDAIVFVSPEEAPILKRIERRLGRPIQRRRVEDFDYDAPAPPTPKRKPRPPVTVGPSPKRSRKPNRGQGRR